MPKKAGRDWGRARAKHTVAKLRQAVVLRRKGMKLQAIQKVTGISPSYLCKLTTSFLRGGRGRALGLPTDAALALLRARLLKLEKESREIRSQIRKLTTAEPKMGLARMVEGSST